LNLRKINLVSAVLLAVGWSAAIIIYLTTEPPKFDPLLGDPLTNKKFVHELRVWGGKGAVANAELTRDFQELWRGRNLAGTLAVVTIIITLGFRFVALRPDIYRGEPIDKMEPRPSDATD
jgi:hypothetical protein